MRRVVVTGMGMVTPVGNDMESTWTALLEGHSGVGTISLFDARTFRTRIAAEVKDFQLGRYRDDAGRWANHSRNTKFALAAAEMAIKDSGLLESRPVVNSAVRRLPGSRRGPARLSTVRQARAQVDARSQGADVRIHAPGAARAPSDRRSRTGARNSRRAPGQRLRRQGAERELPDCLRRQLPGNRRGLRDDPRANVPMWSSREERTA